jgi:hypothetical protein
MRAFRARTTLRLSAFGRQPNQALRRDIDEESLAVRVDLTIRPRVTAKGLTVSDALQRLDRRATGYFTSD